MCTLLSDIVPCMCSVINTCSTWRFRANKCSAHERTCALRTYLEEIGILYIRNYALCTKEQCAQHKRARFVWWCLLCDGLLCLIICVLYDRLLYLISIIQQTIIVHPALFGQGYMANRQSVLCSARSNCSTYPALLGQVALQHIRAHPCSAQSGCSAHLALLD